MYKVNLQITEGSKQPLVFYYKYVPGGCLIWRFYGANGHFLVRLLFSNKICVIAVARLTVENI
jgi:hypothetical protein